MDFDTQSPWKRGWSIFTSHLFGTFFGREKVGKCPLRLYWWASICWVGCAAANTDKEWRVTNCMRCWWLPVELTRWEREINDWFKAARLGLTGKIVNTTMAMSTIVQCWNPLQMCDNIQALLQEHISVGISQLRTLGWVVPICDFMHRRKQPDGIELMTIK